MTLRVGWVLFVLCWLLGAGIIYQDSVIQGQRAIICELSGVCK